MGNLETTKNANIKNYNIKYIPTESTAGGTRLYMANHLACKPNSILIITKAINLNQLY